MDWLESHAELARMNAPNQGLFPERILHLHTSPTDLKRGLLALPIISHLPGRLASKEQWITGLTDAISECKLRGWRVIASVGLSCWEIPARIAARMEVPLLLILPPNSSNLDKLAEEAVRELNLHPSLVGFLGSTSPEKFTRNEGLRARDQLAGALSQVWLPVSVRPKGYWEGIVPFGAKVDSRFASPYPSGVPIPDYRNHPASPESEWFPSSEYLYHFTRGSYAPWPGERRADYYDAVIDGTERINPRDEAATLNGILQSGILRGSSRLYRSHTPAISFTAAKPVDFIRNTFYRPGLHHRTAEPFGIAISKKTLVCLGARPVIYGTAEDYEKLKAEDRPYFQLADSTTAKWESEQEWRLVGDLDIHSLSAEILAIIPTLNQRLRIGLTRVADYLPLFLDRT